MTIRIFSTKLGKIVDVSEDNVSGSVHRITNGVSTADFTLLNRARKYEGIFSPMDRVVIYMRRIRAMMVLSGYLDEVPLWSALPNSVRYSASCTMKRLQNFYWDPGSPAATGLFQASSTDNANLNDGGLAKRAVDTLTEVVGWPASNIHIGAIPEDWYTAVAAVKEEYVTEAELAKMALQIGGDSYLNGEAPLVNSYSTVPGIGPGTGTLPATSGRISYFGGVGTSDATGNMALTGESGTNPRDPWYCAMRWPYVTETLGRKPDVDVGAAKAWWRDRRLIVTSPDTGKSIVVRAADWGPNISTGRVIDVSKTAIEALGVSTDAIVRIAFTGEDDKTTPCGPIDATQAPQGPPSNLDQSGGISGAITEWGAHGTESDMVTVSAGGCSFTVNRRAADRFVGFVNDLVSIFGYKPKSIGGYNDRYISGTTRWSNHAWGAAIDIDPSINPYGTASTPYALPKPPGIVQLARKWGLGWGGEWSSAKDWMHFEVIGAPSSPSYGPAPGGQSVVTESTKPKMWQSPLQRPYKVSRRFSQKHVGTDFANGAPGGAIHPVGPGVVKATVADDPVYGNTVTIDHGSGVYTFYAHMEELSPLNTGDQVTTETTLGTVGDTGTLAGSSPHVHVELRLDSDTPAAAAGSGGIEKYIQGIGNSPPPRGVTGSTTSDLAISDVDNTGAIAGQGVDATLDNIGGGLLNVWAWAVSSPTEAGLLLSGKRALMNDVPVLDTISDYLSTGFREYCSAPNGDFIGWFPDFYGHYKMAGKLVISPLEIDLDNPPVIRWGDSQLKTHHFVTGSTDAYANDAGQITRMFSTAGIASIEDVKLVKALLNVSSEEAEAIAATTAARYGARPSRDSLGQITGADQEFYKACMNFMKNWSQQWRTSINVTFMPEAFPGMLACFPVYGIQGYITEVMHSWDYSDGGGFSTSISAAPWSTLGDAGPSGMPKGAPL